MGLIKTENLPIIPLARDTVLLPGNFLRVPLSNRPDILALFAHTAGDSIASSQRLTRLASGAIVLGCVPLDPHRRNQDGQKLLEGPEAGHSGRQERTNASTQEAIKLKLFNYGTMARFQGFDTRRIDELAILVEGVRRFRIDSITQENPFLEAKVTYHSDDAELQAPDVELQASFVKLKALSKELLLLLRLSSLLLSVRAPRLSALLGQRFELFVVKKEIKDAGDLADVMTSVLNASVEERLQLLATWNVKRRLEKTVEYLLRRIAQIKDTTDSSSLDSNTPTSSMDINQLKRKIPDGWPPLPLGDDGFERMPPWGVGGQRRGGEEEENELEGLKRRLNDAKLSLEAQKVAHRELKRLSRMSPAQVEYQVCRNYLETLSEIPWSKTTEDQLGRDTLTRARQQLDDDHYGLEKVKKRLLEYLAVLKLKQVVKAELNSRMVKEKEDTANASTITEAGSTMDSGEQSDPSTASLHVLKPKDLVDRSPILLLVGPPGTGKTSLANSVATALGRKFHRISLGGVRDEAEIRGHRRTYVAAMPGLIVNGLRKTGVANPVFLLDEIDKVGMSRFHGDPSAAMLEVLDPEQNHTFTDHYLNIPLDLSRVLFIATANSLDTIPPPLLDRMETISLSGYTMLEKRHIATRHLAPKQIVSQGLREGFVCFSDEVLDKIISSYTREAGVRNLEREIGAVCRAKAVEYADAKDASKLENYKPEVSITDLEDILGMEKYDEELAEKTSRPGVVTGLVAYSIGGNGSILFIEVADMPGNGRVQLTGKLGDVLKESVEVALTWVKAHSYELGLTTDPAEDIMKNRSIHVHCPSGAIPKDGPSAGLAHTIALISLFSGRPVRPTLAMTGEISLRGRVTAVGGIKEKLIGALRAGVTNVLLPVRNRKDGKDLPQEVKEGLEIIYVGHIWEAIRHVWPEARWPGAEHLAGIESRL